jgi:NAD(P)-dependent dehydrogenase (short-subunit alcohol dehydrogenase family)
MDKLSQKVAVITGGSSGIGLATAKLFLQHGARVVLFARAKEGLAQAKETLGKDVLTIQGDVGDSRALAQLFHETERTYGKVNVLFANAAVVKLAPIAETSDDVFHEIVATNLQGAFMTLRHGIPHLADGASVVLTSSWLNRMGFAGSSVVAMTKAAVRSLARVAAAELGPRKIRVNALCPGAIETPLWGKLGLPEAVLKAAGESITAQVPLGRWGKAEELARAALFLASEDSSYMNGAELQLDGGLRQA